MKTPLYQTKTFWTGVAGGATALGAWLGGDIGNGALLQTVLTALIGMFLREGMSRERLKVR